MATREIDVTKAEEFAGRMLGVLNSGMLTLLISIGHQVRLFDTMAAGEAGTSAEIATAAGLDERYVREWLAGTDGRRHRRARPRSRHLHAAS